MKNIIVLGVFVGMSAFAADGSATAGKIPEGAKEVQPYTYSFTDASGTKWTYRQTPFGLTKWQDSDIPKPAMPEQPNPVSATDLGDRIRFERKTPFGQYVWTRKKTELSGDEKGLLAIAESAGTLVKATGTK
jgi:hypothetical protein